MTTSNEQDLARPLEASLRPILLPEICAKLALGAKISPDQEVNVIVSFEGDAIRLHIDDFEICKRVALRVRQKLPASLSKTAIIQAVIQSQQLISDDLFRPAAIRVLFYAVMSKPSAFYRCLMPLFALNQGRKCMGHASVGKFSRTAFEYDVVVFQIDNSPYTQSCVETLKQMGKKVVYEIDDAFDCMEPWHPQYASYGQPERQQSLFKMMALADAVQVSTPWLMDRYAKYSKRIEVIPNLLELAAWPPAPKLRNDGYFKVVWAGSSSHSGDLAQVIPALRKFSSAHQDVKVVLFGQEIKEHGIPQLETIPWCEFEQYPFKLAEIDADVSLAPLADIPFNYGKSNLRILQMWATGYPVIASDVGPYKATITHLKDGLLCRTAEDWVVSLEMVYQNRLVRESLIAGGHEAVKAYDVHPNLSRIEEFYSSLVGR